YRFGVEETGNAAHDPQGEFRGQNIGYIARGLDETANKFGKSEDEIAGILDRSRERLFSARATRPRPHLDDKILTDWNGLMIMSLAQGARVLRDPRLTEAARRAADLLLAELVRPDGRLLHRYRAGEAAIAGYIGDYASFANALFDLYQATFEPRYLAEARRLTHEMVRLFWDKERGGFYFSGEGAEELIAPTREIYDGAVPSGNSLAALALLRIGRLTGERELERRAVELFTSFSGAVGEGPSAYTQLLIALDFALGPSNEIILSAEPGAAELDDMIAVIFSRWNPNKVVAFRPIDDAAAAPVVEIIPFIENQKAIGGKATAYVCENYICAKPAVGVDELESRLRDPRPPSR
ncbi:MAG: thioredoxin domain-containing protein, partial [Vicinamibacteria bacterium]